ncbi:MAG: hypothetical protein NT060_00840 [Candidatus Omnitrophica bacterium]|nr:hypothetical protein [Candidatus Omnitrophota bacterium]
MILDKKRDMNISVCLTGVIPLLVVFYLITRKISDFRIFTGEVGYIMLLTVTIFMLGIFVGRRMFMNMLSELMEKSRLAAVTETVLTVGHEINNPLLAIRGNLELIEPDGLPENIKKRIATVKADFERIREATEKLSRITKPVPNTIYGDIGMVDLNKSGQV